MCGATSHASHNLGGMTRSSKPRHELHPGPQTWLGKLVGAEVGDDCRNNIFQHLTNQELMRTFLLCKRTLAASPHAMQQRQKKIASRIEAVERRKAQFDALLSAPENTIKMWLGGMTREMFELNCLHGHLSDAHKMLANIALSLSSLRHWRLLLPLLANGQASLKDGVATLM